MKKIITTVSLLLLSTGLLAGSLKTGNPERKPKTQVLMTEQQSKRINKYNEFLADEKYAEAKSGLEAMLAKTGSRDAYVQSVIYQLLGHIASAQGRYGETAKYFKKSIDLDALPNRTHFGMMLQLAQIKMINKDYRGALKSLDEYFAVANEIPDTAFAIKANTHAQMEQFRETKKAIKQAIQLADKPKETWYQLLLASHAELSEYREMADVLKILIGLKPNKKVYWKQLSSVLFSIKDDKGALAVLEMAHIKGLLTEEAEYLQLFKLYSYNDVPLKAGKTLQQALESGKVKPQFKYWKQLGAAWYEAKELDKALLAYDKASTYAKDGEMDLTRGYLYVDQENWKKAAESIGSALKKGGLNDKKTGAAWLMLGMSNAYLNRFSQARKALRNAAKYKKSKNNAEQWLIHLESLEKRAKEKSANA